MLLLNYCSRAKLVRKNYKKNVQTQKNIMYDKPSFY